MRNVLIAAGVVVCAAGSAARGQSCVAGWAGQFPSGDFDGPIRASLLYDDGTGSAIYVAGAFTTAAGAPARGLARWNGVSWSAVGPGFNGDVNALAVHDDGTGPALYAGGAFSMVGATPANMLAKWNGSAWSAVGLVSGNGSLTGGPIQALTSFNDGQGIRLWVGGDFVRILGGSSFESGVVRWNGTAWALAGSGQFSGRVKCFTVHTENGTTRLYAAGRWSSSSSPVQRWEGNGWSGLTGGAGAPNDTVLAMTPFNDGSGTALYVAGDFTRAGTQPTAYIAKWFNGGWSPVSTGPDQPVRALAVVDNDGPGGQAPVLYAGGAFKQVAGQPAAGLAYFNGAGWSAAGAGTNDEAATLTAFSQAGTNRVFVSGPFSSAGGIATSRVASYGVAQGWGGAGAPGLGAAPSEAVRALAWFDDDGAGPHPARAFAAGEFRTVGGAAVNFIAAWDGAAWSPLGVGANGPVYTLHVHTDESGPALYAGGEFTSIGGVAANGVARWDGASWSALGSGIAVSYGGGSVRTLESYTAPGQATRLVAGGYFNSPSGFGTSGIAAWNGSVWQDVGAVIGGGGAVCLKAFDDGTGSKLYDAGGTFFLTGSTYLARWDGASWSAVPGLSSSAYPQALAVHDNGSGPSLYIAGSNLLQNGFVFDHLARWTGSTCVAVAGGGPSASVTTLMSHDDGTGRALYAAGPFLTSAGGSVMRGLARLSAAGWTEFGGGFTPERGSAVYAMESAPDVPGGPNSLFVGGQFVGAGGVASGRIARWAGCFACYANCDGSTVAPVLNIADFTCFLNRFASEDPYANCDGSTTPPVFNIADFTCFLNRFAAGCP